MRSQFPLALGVLLVLAAGVHAADWFHLGSAQFTARVPVTIENPSEADNPAVPVNLLVSKLHQLMPDASAQTLAVADESNVIVPFQISKLSQDHLLFVVPVKAHETKTVYVYAAKNPVEVPKFEPKTSTDIRQAYRSFENEFTAFRMEIGDKANTTGLAIDLFGKTREGQGVQLKNIYKSEYHKRQPWGIDILKVGLGPGLGGAYIVLGDKGGDKLGRTSAKTEEFHVNYEGPVVSNVQASGPVEIDGKKFTVSRTVKVLAGDRALLDEVDVKPENPDDADNIKIGLGLRNLPGETWTEKPEAGYAFVAGDGNQAGTDKLGLGVAFKPATYITMQELPDKTDGGHIYVFKPRKTSDGVLRLHDRLLAYWNGDGWITTPDQFETALKTYGQLMTSPAKVSLADKAETR